MFLEQDHRFVKKRTAASLWFRSVDGALRTIAGYEAMNMIRKGQVKWLAKGDVVGRRCSSSESSGSRHNIARFELELLFIGRHAFATDPKADITA